jgi:hypothetical protein
MKTLIIYNDFKLDLKYYIADGDYSRFNGVMVNAVSGHEFEEEFCDWMWGKDNEYDRVKEFTEDVSLIEEKQWDKVVVCSFLP